MYLAVRAQPFDQIDVLLAPPLQAFVEAAMQMGASHNDDFNGARQTGVGRFDAMVHNGQRQSSKAAYLRTRPANLHIHTQARVRRVMLQAGRAIGVQADIRGRPVTLRAQREVISCLGAFESPKLLMLSGIGPAGHLTEHAIPVELDLPGVGEMVSDYRSGLGMPRRAKVVAIGCIVLFAGGSAAFGISNLVISALVAALGAIGVWYVAFRVPTRESVLAARSESDPLL